MDSPPNNTDTFRERTRKFSEWFPTVAEKFAASFENGTAAELVAEHQQQFRSMLSGLSWVFGPGETSERTSFTVTGEGRPPLQLLSHYWLEHVGKVPGWDFYSSRQASTSEQLVLIGIEIGDSTIDAESLQISTDLDTENRTVNIRAWHDAFEPVNEDARMQILFLLLDEALGEFGTQTKVGRIEFEKTKNAMSLTELPEFLDKIWLENEWESTTPLETYTGYGTDTPSCDFERGDTIAGHTCVPGFLMEFLRNGGRNENDPLKGTGAEFVYVQIDGDFFPEGKEVEFRARIENALVDSLAGQGYITGGATGVNHSYIDLVLFDGERSLESIQSALSELKLAGKHSIRSYSGQMIAGGNLAT